MNRLNEAIHKQEKDIETRDKAIDQEFETEIKELEEALQTIQNQKIAIINKIKEIEDGYNEVDLLRLTWEFMRLLGS